jgi:ribonuclease E
MAKSIVISERDNIAAVSENGRVLEFFIHRGDILLGDVYLAKVENILPSIDAAFVNVGSDKMGFLHASDVTGKGALKERLTPGQSVMVQVVKEPTGHKGPRVTMSLSIPGRFLVIMPNEKGVNVSKKIASSKERARLKSIVSLLKPTGVGVIIRTEAENQSEAEIQEDLEYLLEKWNSIITASDTVKPPSLVHRDQDLLYRVIREACTDNVDEIILDTSFGFHRATQLLQSWNISHKLNLSVHKGNDSILVAKGIEKEIRNALQTKVNLPSGGYLYIQTTEALSVIDVNSGKFTSSATQDETIRKTNLEAVEEIARQLRLRNIGGMIIVDFIDMENRVDKLAILEAFELALEPDKSKPQIGQLSDLGLVELTRHRQGQSLAEIFTKKCQNCNGNGTLIEDFNFSAPPMEGETVVKTSKLNFVKPSNKVPVTVNESRKQVHSTVQNRITHTDTKKIETNPSMAASSASQQPQQTESAFILNNQLINDYFSESSYVPSASKMIRYFAVPSGVARNLLGRGYSPDVFTILQEIESFGAPATPEPQQQPQPQQMQQQQQNQHNRRPQHNVQQRNQQQPQQQQMQVRQQQQLVQQQPQAVQAMPPSPPMPKVEQEIQPVQQQIIPESQETQAQEQEEQASTAEQQKKRPPVRRQSNPRGRQQRSTKPKQPPKQED